MTPKTKKTKIENQESELRQDIVSGDFVVIATGRAKRPDEFASVNRATVEVVRSEDPFDNPEESGQEKDVLIYRRDDGDWSLRVFPNKYPAFSRGRAARELSEGPYFGMSGVGYHEVIVTRDPAKSLGLLDTWQVAEVIDAYHERYLDLMNKKTIKYIQVFHNHGKVAGASIAHPHSQLIALPVVSPFIRLELDGAEEYFRRTKEYVYQIILEHELKEKKRIIFENEHFIAYCPYASVRAFEINIMGKRPNPYFERIKEEEKFALGEVLRKSLGALYTGLNDVPYNFFIHTAPCDGRDYAHYQWQIKILPHTSIWAGFEFSTGIEVSTIPPEEAAQYLRAEIEKSES